MKALYTKITSILYADHHNDRRRPAKQRSKDRFRHIQRESYPVRSGGDRPFVLRLVHPADAGHSLDGGRFYWLLPGADPVIGQPKEPRFFVIVHGHSGGN